MAKPPALIGGLMIGTAAWLEVWAVFFLAPGHYGLALIPGLFFVAGLFLAGAFVERTHPIELAIGGICVAVAVGFVMWFIFITYALTAALVSLAAGVLILVGLVFIAGRDKGY